MINESINLKILCFYIPHNNCFSESHNLKSLPPPPFLSPSSHDFHEYHNTTTSWNCHSILIRLSLFFQGQCDSFSKICQSHGNNESIFFIIFMEYNVNVFMEQKFYINTFTTFCMKFRTLLPGKTLLKWLHEKINFLHFNFPHLFAFPTNFPHLLFFIFLFCSFIYGNTCYYNRYNIHYNI